jgi:hypothetical protein
LKCLPGLFISYNCSIGNGMLHVLKLYLKSEYRFTYEQVSLSSRHRSWGQEYGLHDYPVALVLMLWEEMKILFKMSHVSKFCKRCGKLKEI